ncbi:EAL domain-containing protein [Thiohalobacter sp. IOR34]|uniref:sensor domain-containing protein n=1 Tax=Thiohalobacter sp. IOR34 TaxID=3057176 RepID=UPI0025B2104B|nr:EAL domain-containing protein [Thiohalobacter sp. IOR34]WJW76369.1 EAL domain-containing protein [Thiohalobacter sp. IOR34]
MITDLPARIKRGEQGQVALRMLDAVRPQMLALKVAQEGWLSRREQGEALADAELRGWRDDGALRQRVDEYREAGLYNARLIRSIDVFEQTLSAWMEAESDLRRHFNESADGQNGHLAQHVLRADSLFLAALYRLADGEAPIHRDIEDGRRASHLLQLSGLGLLVYLFLLVAYLLYSRMRELNRSRQILDQAHRRLVTSEQDLRITLDSIGDAVIATDAEGRVTRMNPVAEQLTGWQEADARGRSLEEVFRIVNSETGAVVESPVSKVLREGSVVGLANHTALIDRQGRQRQISDSGAPIRDDSGRIRGVVLVFRDVTEEYRLEQALHDSERRLREAQRIARLGHWTLDIGSGALRWSDEIFRIFEIDPAQFGASYEAFLERVHPEDRERVDQAYQDSVREHRPYQVTHRLLFEDGRIKHVIERGETFYDEQGRPLYSIGTVQDVSEQMEAAEELRLAATTFESHTGILITDAEGTIQRVNPAMAAMTGYSAEELVGNNPRILQSGRQDRRFYRQMWEMIRDTGRWQGELWNRRKDGELYAEWLTITAVKDSAGRVTHYIGTSQDITERKRAEARIQHLAYYDDLTGLPNRRLFLDRLEHELAVARRRGLHGAVLFLDLDRFKTLNDALGHPIGDLLLREVSRRLIDQVRAEDTVARLGGDEFVILLPELSSELDQAGFEAQAVAEKIAERLADPYDLEGHIYYLTASLGIVLFPGDVGEKESVDDILKHADSAMYQAKDAGRNTVRFFLPSMQAAADARLALEKDLRQALENEELVLHYQPQLDAEGRLLGAEALLRWNSPARGMVPPDAFIPIAEETGLILDLGDWVLRAAAAQIREWEQNGMLAQVGALAVNVSPRQFHQADFSQRVLDILAGAGVTPRAMKLEITEGVVMDSVGEAIEKMQVLKAAGIGFSLDDFGTGYSSLSYLQRLPIDTIKIDRSFIRDIADNPGDAAIVETILAMAAHLELEVVAEGVETQQALELLQARGCRAYQGYYFSHPLEAEAFARFVREVAGKAGNAVD